MAPNATPAAISHNSTRPRRVRPRPVRWPADSGAASSSAAGGGDAFSMLAFTASASDRPGVATGARGCDTRAPLPPAARGASPGCAASFATAGSAIAIGTAVGWGGAVWITGAAGVAAAAAVTLSLAAGGAGFFHYITRLVMQRFATAALTAAATPIVVTTTNLPGSKAFSFPADAAAQGVVAQEVLEPTVPIRSSAANTATTIVCPATTAVIWRVTADYYLAP